MQTRELQTILRGPTTLAQLTGRVNNYPKLEGSNPAAARMRCTNYSNLW